MSLGRGAGGWPCPLEQPLPEERPPRGGTGRPLNATWTSSFPTQAALLDLVSADLPSRCKALGGGWPWQHAVLSSALVRRSEAFPSLGCPVPAPPFQVLKRSWCRCWKTCRKWRKNRESSSAVRGWGAQVPSSPWERHRANPALLSELGARGRRRPEHGGHSGSRQSKVLEGATKAGAVLGGRGEVPAALSLHLCGPGGTRQPLSGRDRGSCPLNRVCMGWPLGLSKGPLYIKGRGSHSQHVEPGWGCIPAASANACCFSMWRLLHTPRFCSLCSCRA